MQYRQVVLGGFVCAFAGAALQGATAKDFFQAIRSNELEQVRALSVERANLTAADSKGVTPLLYASAFGSLESMKLLLDAGADVNGKDSFEQVPLHWAACDPARVRLLVERGANVNAKTKSGRTALMAASACQAAEESVKLLLGKGADVNAVQQTGTTALLEAAGYGGCRIARMLLSAGAKPDVADAGGYTPLMAAAGAGDVELVRELLAKGAQVNAKNTFSGVVKNGDIQLKSLTPLMLGVPTGSAELVRVLLEAGADVKARDLRGMTPLMMAAASEYQNAEVVKLLIDRGSDVNAVSEIRGDRAGLGEEVQGTRCDGVVEEGRGEGESAAGRAGEEGRCASGCAFGGGEERPAGAEGIADVLQAKRLRGVSSSTGDGYGGEGGKGERDRGR